MDATSRLLKTCDETRELIAEALKCRLPLKRQAEKPLQTNDSASPSKRSRSYVNPESDRPASHSASEQTTGAIVEAPAVVLDREAFLRRLGTFTDTFITRHRPVNAVQCAMHGFIDTHILEGPNHDICKLVCETCQNTNYVLDFTKMNASDHQLQAILDKYSSGLKLFHKDSCVWRNYQCPPQIYSFPRTTHHEAIEEIRKEGKRLMEHGADLLKIEHPLDPEQLKKLEYFIRDAENPAGRYQFSPTPLSPLSDAVWSSYILPLFGWKLHDNGMLKCPFCLRQISPNPLYDADHIQLNLVQKHRDYCPWVNSNYAQIPPPRPSPFIKSVCGYEWAIATVELEYEILLKLKDESPVYQLSRMQWLKAEQLRSKQERERLSQTSADASSVDLYSKASPSDLTPTIPQSSTHAEAHPTLTMENPQHPEEQQPSISLALHSIEEADKKEHTNSPPSAPSNEEGYEKEQPRSPSAVPSVELVNEKEVESPTAVSEDLKQDAEHAVGEEQLESIEDGGEKKAESPIAISDDTELDAAHLLAIDNTEEEHQRKSISPAVHSIEDEDEKKAESPITIPDEAERDAGQPVTIGTEKEKQQEGASHVAHSIEYDDENETESPTVFSEVAERDAEDSTMINAAEEEQYENVLLAGPSIEGDNENKTATPIVVSEDAERDAEDSTMIDVAEEEQYESVSAPCIEDEGENKTEPLVVVSEDAKRDVEDSTMIDAAEEEQHESISLAAPAVEDEDENKTEPLIVIPEDAERDAEDSTMIDATSSIEDEDENKAEPLIVVSDDAERDAEKSTMVDVTEDIPQAVAEDAEDGSAPASDRGSVTDNQDRRDILTDNSEERNMADSGEPGEAKTETSILEIDATQDVSPPLVNETDALAEALTMATPLLPKHLEGDLEEIAEAVGVDIGEEFDESILEEVDKMGELETPIDDQDDNQDELYLDVTEAGKEKTEDIKAGTDSQKPMASGDTPASALDDLDDEMEALPKSPSANGADDKEELLFEEMKTENAKDIELDHERLSNVSDLDNTSTHVSETVDEQRLETEEAEIKGFPQSTTAVADFRDNEAQSIPLDDIQLLQNEVEERSEDVQSQPTVDGADTH
ncbi:C3HC zinc finger-like-domain-containing protein [Dichotomocladium elegans]|nr:C3HC zinc finger-like-domain-containing protein [Dichotomocladium elegans]